MQNLYSYTLCIYIYISKTDVSDYFETMKTVQTVKERKQSLINQDSVQVYSPRIMHRIYISIVSSPIRSDSQLVVTLSSL